MARSRILAEPRRSETVGETFARRYRILETIGQGAMGTVYKALDTRLQRLVALKIFYVSPDAESKQRLERFQGEAAHAPGLSHPNIPQMYDVGEADGLVYAAVEYIEGRSLWQVIRERRPLDPTEAIRITCQVGRALEYAHQHGVVHRDVNPSNILISNEGRVLLLDLGLALRPAETHTLGRLGTAFMSPEQVMGGRVDARSDIFSLGAVLYELLTGRPPFFGQTPYEILYQIAKEEPLPLEGLNSSLASSLGKVVLKSMAKDPKQRFQTAAEFVYALAKATGSVLDEFLVGEPSFQREIGSPLSAEPRAQSSASADKTGNPQDPASQVAEERNAKRRGIEALESLPQPKRTPKLSWLAATIAAVLGVALCTAVAVRSLPYTAAVLAGFVAWLVLFFVASHTKRNPATRTALRYNPSPLTVLDLGGSAARTGQTTPTVLQHMIEPHEKADQEVPTEVAAYSLQPSYPSVVAWLQFVDGAGTHREIRLSDSVTVGRNTNNDVIVSENNVSGWHARISLENGCFFISDLDTPHGTFVNGVPVQKCELRDQDQISLGLPGYTMLFVQESTADLVPQRLSHQRLILSPEVERKLREFYSTWEELTNSARHG